MNKLLFWTCEDECKYDCMWKTTNSFLDRKWAVPQFYGKVNTISYQICNGTNYLIFAFKWPFLRILGFQEPASVVFSIFNFLAHFKMIQRFRKEVRKDSPCYKVWHIFAGVSQFQANYLKLIKKKSSFPDKFKCLVLVNSLPYKRFPTHRTF